MYKSFQDNLLAQEFYIKSAGRIQIQSKFLASDLVSVSDSMAVRYWTTATLLYMWLFAGGAASSLKIGIYFLLHHC